MIRFLRLLFFVIFISMLYITVTAGLHENMFDAIQRLSNDPWAVATLWDAYFGFLTFYLWVFYKEKWLGRFVWFFLIMTLGNMAMALYALIQLYRVPTDASFSDVILKKYCPQAGGPQ